MESNVEDFSHHNQTENIWTTLPPSLISSNVWLPLDVSTESINELLQYLTLSEHLACLTLDKAMKKSRKYCGIVCSAKAPIILNESGILRDNLYSKKIENSDLTVDLLNIRISTKAKSEPTIMENYLASLFGNNDDIELTNHLKASIPIAFAHNSVARKLTANLDTLIYKEEHSTEKEYIYSFVVLPIGDAESSSSESEEPADEVQTQNKYDVCYIDSSGRLVKILELSSKSMEEFRTILTKLGAVEIFALYENELGKLRRELEVEKQLLQALKPDLSMYPLYDDESLSANDWREMSALSEEIDNAEDFELCIEGADESMKSHETSAVSSSSNSKEIRELEKRVRDLAKKISVAKMELIEENGANSEKYVRLKKDFYSSLEYLHFSKFYRENVLEKTGMTPKSVNKSSSRIKERASTSTIIKDVTPSRKRKSKSEPEKNQDENASKDKSSNSRKRPSISSAKALREKNENPVAEIAPAVQKRRSKRLNDADDNETENEEKLLNNSTQTIGKGKKRKSAN